MQSYTRTKNRVEPSSFAGMRIVVLGLARQGVALARYFCAAGATVTISDVASEARLAEELKQIGSLPVSLALGGHPESLLDQCDLLCLSGGVPPQIPFVQKAIARGIPLSNDSLLTLQMAPCPVVAITGSSGKTTTTTLVGEMLRRTLSGWGQRVHVGGNIGTPLLDRLHQIRGNDLIVLELSSFQLELFDDSLAFGELGDLGPDVAAILNLTPNHLDRHPSMAAYVDAKLNLLRRLRPDSAVVLSADDPVCRAIATGQTDNLPPKWGLCDLVKEMHQRLTLHTGTILLFSREQAVERGAWLAEGALVHEGEPFCQRGDVRLRGDHNVSNVLAAAAISGAMGATPAAMGQVARSFGGVPHRLEEVARIGNTTWINDSIATAPERAIAGLRTFEPGAQSLILLAGGKDKNLPWGSLADEILRRVNFLIGFGQSGPMIVETVQRRALFQRRPAPSTAVVQRLDEAVQLAAQLSRQLPPGESVVLLSPGGTSFDAYKNFEERGEHFRQLVSEAILIPEWAA